MAERERADLRLLDVLLEEELGGADAARTRPPLRATRWLAAAMLFGVAVVGATAWAARATSVSREAQPATQPTLQIAAQEPKQAGAVQPKDLAELRKLLGDVKKIVLAPSEKPRGVPILTDVPILGTLFVVDDAARGGTAVISHTPYLRDFEVPDVQGVEVGTELAIDAPARVQQWAVALRQCDAFKGGNLDLPAPWVALDLSLVLADGRMLKGIAQNARQDGMEVVAIGGLWLSANAEVNQLLADGREAVLRAARLRAGIAASRDELRALPATATAIQMPPFDPAVLRAELPRFTALERLAIVPVGLCQLPTGDAVTAIAAVPTLRTLVLPADALTDADVDALAALPLRLLGLTGRLRGLTAAPFARLRTLETLALDVDSSMVDLRALLAALPALKTFACGKADLLDDAIDALLATKVERLCLQAAKLDAPRLARLAQLPSLRELRLHAARIGPDEAAALAGMRLRRLELAPVIWFRPDGRGDAVDLDALRARLPGCVIEETPVGATGAWWRSPK